MLFTSPIFLFLFLPIVIILYRILPNRIFIKNLFLLLASSMFYYYGEQEKILIMYFVILLNWGIALYIDSGTIAEGTYKGKTKLQKVAMGLCLFISIGLLWYYKYLNFSIEVLNAIFSFQKPLELISGIVLPLGISFYTFHVLSYTLDVYCGRLKVEKSFFNFCSYVLMFPQLIAGPIVRYIDIKYQFYNRTITPIGFVNGIRTFCYGLSKKVLIANTISVYVDNIFSKPVDMLSTADCWLGAIGYTLQIYFDFSGYSSMAIGLAMLFGFHYKENFNYPYIAKSAAEFWRRWHISLSTWLRDYVYINMGGNRVAAWRRYANVLFVFLCSGLWHGANFTFVCWGLLYGIFIVIENMGFNKLLKKSSFLAHVYLPVLATTAWVLFRADDMAYASIFIGKMYLFNAVDWHCSIKLENNVIFAMLVGIALSYDWRYLYKRLCISLVYKVKSKKPFMIQKLLGVALSIILFVISVASIMSSSYNPFIYFRF
ncbi:MBOAT family protein [uncultured Phascolarctobacterium sp.]|uniref:MBOAT family O-acyltransferase n=1 Tax=uncultured Phascolarctobacterium sp. TaxID=512296 RepID=UPI0025E31D28|nr:MBOAT family O-acyltransferase [uncultured Phascolarctobacterium sp.]